MDLVYFVVAYDIRSNRRRRKVLAALKNYGLPVQLSVVECELDPARLGRLKQEVRGLINPRTDRVRIYRLCENCFFRLESFGATLPSRQKA
jgi:CRISPR-associated protein Cas2